MPTGIDRQHDLGWILDQLLAQEPQVLHAVAVSADGLVLAHSSGIDRDDADRRAAMISGLASITGRMCQDVAGQAVIHTVVTMLDRVALIIAIPGSVSGSLTVVTHASPDIGRVGYACAEHVKRLGHALSVGPAATSTHAQR